MNSFRSFKKILFLATGCTLVAVFCTIQISTKGTKKNTFNLSDILEPLEKNKILSVKDLMGLALEITIVDKSEKPVSEAFLVLQSTGFLDSLRADHNGIVQLILTDTLINMNPAIYARKNTIKLGTRTRLYGEIAAEEKPVIIKINDFLSQVKNGQVVLYKPIHSSLVDTLLEVLNKQKEYVITHLKLTPIPWGVVLIDTSAPIILDRSHFVKDTIYFHLYPLKSAEGPRGYYVGNFRTYIKNTLLDNIEISENPFFWIFNGLADYFTNRFLSTIKNEKRKAENLYFYRNEEEAKIRSFSNKKGRKSVNILKWNPKTQLDWFYGYAVFFTFWEKVAHDYGEEAIVKFIEEAKAVKSPSLEITLNILEKYTDKRVKTLLESFPYSLVNEFIEQK